MQWIFILFCDGSCKTSNGALFNYKLQKVPTIRSSLYSILLKFRNNNVALTAKIEKIYRVWWVLLIYAINEFCGNLKEKEEFEITEDILEYELTTVIFGLFNSHIWIWDAWKQLVRFVKTNYHMSLRLSYHLCMLT